MARNLKKKKNQWKENPPLELIEPRVRYYHSLGYTFPAILQTLKHDYDTTKYGLGRTKLQQLCDEWGLKGTKKQAHTFDTIHGPIQQLKEKFPTAGAGQMRHLLRTEFGMRVPKEKIAQYNRHVDPDGVRARKRNKLKRRVFYAAGVNHIWAMDQHDKWKRLGLRIHLCTEAFVGKLMWLVVWWTNSNPTFIAGQYFKAIDSNGGYLPCVTQSDLGTENYGVAYAHTTMRHHLDETLAGTLQHNWLGGHRNVKPEAEWSMLRSMWSPGFEDMLESGVLEGWYNPANKVDNLVFRWIAIPYVQAELDAYLLRHNSTARWANAHKVLPRGVPDVMYMHPQSVDALDFKIKVDPELLASARDQYASPDDPVFQLVPPAFQIHVSAAYVSIGSPEVTFKSFWDVYRQLRDEVDNLPMTEQVESEIVAPVPETERLEDPTPLFTPLRFGTGAIPDVIGDDGAPGGCYPQEFAAFTDDEDDNAVAFTDSRVDELF